MTKEEALQMCLEYIETNAHERKHVRHAIQAALAQPAQEPVACERCKQLEEQAYDLLGQLQVANLKRSVAHPQRIEEDDDIQEYKRPWVGLTDQESIDIIKKDNNYKYPIQLLQAVMDALKEKNT